MDVKTFLSDLQQLPEMLCWVREHLDQLHVDVKVASRVELAVEEALVNVIEHAYEEKKGNIELSFQWNEIQLEIAICDWGPSFDPLTQAPEVFIDAPLEERGIGGLGVHLIRQLMDEVYYFRKGTMNTLILIKRFSQKP